MTPKIRRGQASVQIESENIYMDNRVMEYTEVIESSPKVVRRKKEILLASPTNAAAWDGENGVMWGPREVRRQRRTRNRSCFVKRHSIVNMSF